MGGKALRSIGLARHAAPELEGCRLQLAAPRLPEGGQGRGVLTPSASTSGELGEEQPPTTSDRKISFSVTGPLAKEMFDSMYPDAKEACSDDEGHRERYKGNVSCVRDSDGYTCHFGFNLRYRRKHLRRDMLIVTFCQIISRKAAAARPLRRP